MNEAQRNECPSEVKRSDVNRLVMFVVTAYRWGGRENHSYVVGVYSSKEKAKSVALEHHKYRGGKYDCEVMMIPVDSDYEDREKQTVISIYTDTADVHEVSRCCWCGAEKELHNPIHAEYLKRT